MAGKMVCKINDGRGGLNGQVYLVALESLPPEAQRRYLERTLATSLPITGPAEETKAVAPAPSPAPARIRTVAELVAKHGREKAEQILAQAEKWEPVVKEALAIIDGRGKDKMSRINALAMKRKVSAKTLYRKAGSYKEDGILGLVDDRYRSCGEGLDGKERRAVTPEVRNFIRSMALQYPPPKGSKIYKDLEKAAEIKDWPMPSRATVYRVIEEILHSEKVMGQRGDKEYEATCMPKVKRDYSHLLAMEEIVGDGHPFDLFVEWAGRAVRPQLSAWEDMRSRKIVGWCVTVQCNSETIGLALRHAILTHGLPARIYTDNGKDYLSKYIKDVCQRLDIRTRECIPKTPRAKMIERLFRTVHDQFTLYLPGYCGNKPENRPPGFNEKKLLEQGKLLPMEEFVERWAAYVEQYNSQVHSEIKDTPTNAFANTPHVRPGRVNQADLDILMMKREQVKVNAGYITLLGREYWSHNIELGRLVGEWVQVWYDFNRMGEVLIWYKGKCLGTAVNRKALEHGESRADLTAELRANRQVAKAVKRQIASYTEGLEDVLPENVVKRSRRAKRNFEGQAVADTSEAKVMRLTGYEKETREAQKVIDSEAADAGGDAPVKVSRAQRMLMKAGAKVLAR